MNSFSRLVHRSAVAFALMVLLLGSAACQHGIQQPVWTPLFNGQYLTGWEHIGPGEFVAQDGMLKTVGGMGLLRYSGERGEKRGHSTFLALASAGRRQHCLG